MACAAIALALVPSAASGGHRARDCNWGASSITASYVNGKLAESTPVTTGCTS